ncbi:hypothetical protein FRC02_003328 [Tulasnella sp. 418]|nr:hypothetical protein FRC02_003328 [Tulasnella sp. 418]
MRNASFGGTPDECYPGRGGSLAAAFASATGVGVGGVGAYGSQARFNYEKWIAGVGGAGADRRVPGDFFM